MTVASVVMFVLNDCRSDARVLREAATLVASGHEVTIMARTTDPYAPQEEREDRDGFTIVRVPVVTGVLRWILLGRRPGQALRNLSAAARDAIHSGIAGLARLLAAIGAAIVVAPLVLVVAVPAAIFLLVVSVVPQARWAWRAVEWRVRWRFGAESWATRAAARAPAAAVYHGHDLHGLAAAIAARGETAAPLVYDSHEIFTEMGPYAVLPARSKAAMRRYERRLAASASALVTVNTSIAELLAWRLNLDRVVVVHNTPCRWTPPTVAQDLIRRAGGIPEAAPIVLCHGSFQANRGLDATAKAMLEPGLEAAHLVFLGNRTTTIEPILAEPRLAGRVHHLPAVPPADVVSWVAGADVDVMAILPTDENSVYSTPNKLFESLAAGVPVVSSDLPERSRIITEDPAGQLGALCDPADPRSIAAAIASLIDMPPAERIAMRERCRTAAWERWNWEREGAKLIALYSDLLGSGAA